MNILFAPSAYLLSDKYGTEPYRAYMTIGSISKLNTDDIVSIVGYSEIENPLPKNVKIIEIYRNKKINKSAFLEIADNLKFVYKYYNAASKIMEKEQFDIVHHLNPISPQTYNLIPLLKKLSVPFIIGAALPPQREKSFEEFIHFYRVKPDITAKVIDKSINACSKPLNILFEKTIAKCDKFICATEEAKNFFKKYVSEDKLAVIPCGIDTDFYTPKYDKDEEKDYIEILLLSYLIPRKGIAYGFKAMKNICNKYENVRMRIVGKGPQEDYLKKLAINLGISQKVIFTGFVPHNEIPGYYQNCDIFCSPTLYEPFGHTILEAMSCGKPVVASSVGGIPEILTDSEGILVRPANVEDLTNAFSALLSNLDETKKLGANGRIKTEKMFDWSIIGRRYLDVYKELLK